MNFIKENEINEKNPIIGIGGSDRSSLPSIYSPSSSLWLNELKIDNFYYYTNHIILPYDLNYFFPYEYLSVSLKLSLSTKN